MPEDAPTTNTRRPVRGPAPAVTTLCRNVGRRRSRAPVWCTPVPVDVEELADRVAISDLLTTYADALDRRDWTQYRSVFTADAHIDYRSAGGKAGDVDTVARWLEEVLGGFEMTQHLIANHQVTLDGDEATVRAMFYNPMRATGGGQFFCGGWYNHQLVRTADGWRSRELIEESAWSEGFPNPAG